jgi:hypothetical protein
MTPAVAQDRAALFECDFQKLQPGPLPEDFKVVRGEFAVKQEGTNRFMELSVEQLNTFGVLLGPERGAETSLQARLRGWPTGKRFPEFGVGLGGAKGYQLWLMPAVSEVQIRRDNEILARAPFAWKSGEWVHMQLELRASGDGRWLVAGKAWMDGDKPAADALVRHELSEPPATGRASLWATPYSEKPIQFDDVRLTQP